MADEPTAPTTPPTTQPAPTDEEGDMEDLAQAVLEMGDRKGDKEHVTVTDDIASMLMPEDGGIELPPIPAGFPDKEGRIPHLKVTAKDPGDSTVIAAWLENESKDRVAAMKDLWDAMIVKPLGLTDDATFSRLSTDFRETLTAHLLRVAGFDGFFERLRLYARPELVRAAMKSSVRSRGRTASPSKK